MLKSDEIDLGDGWITHKLSGSGMIARIPVIPQLREYLAQLKECSTGELLLPDQAVRVKLGDRPIPTFPSHLLLYICHPYFH